MRRTRLAPQSAKRQSEGRRRRAVVEEASERDGGCIAATCVPEVQCAGPLDGDERVSRAQRPGGHLDVDNVQTLCRAHHDWRHLYPIEAAHRGLRDYPVGYLGERR